ncbi:MAG: response regulator [Labilithrix sp.]|nr:response regulator [Labilithrix sp.]
MKDTTPNVLIVDDLEANLVALEAVLGDMPCSLVRAKSGNDALKQLLKRDYAVMLLDVQMPEIDGFEVARLARQNPATREVPIIFLTASHSSEDAALRGYGTGAVDVLFKPLNPEILRSKLRVFLELYEARRKLAREVAAHEDTLAELEAFNYSVSHDLRAPLRAVGGFSDILLAECASQLDEDGQGYVRRISAAARNMGALIDDLLRLSQISRASVTTSRVDLAAMVRAIVSELARAEPARVVDVETNEAVVDVDERLMRIALDNLLRNAWKFTRTKETARIELRVRDTPDGRAYGIADDGVGFDPTYAAKLFKPFQRLHTVDEFEGTGIGLAIVDRIIRHHGGRIWAESQPGSGAAFWFVLNA